MEDFEELKNQRILETKERLKSCEDILEKFKSLKSQMIIPTAHQIEKLSKKKKKGWAEALKKREKFLLREKTYKTNLELTKRELKANISAKSPEDMIELTCQECGEQIFGMVCDLCGHNNKNPSTILKITKELVLESKKRGIQAGEYEKMVEVYEKAVMEKEKNDKIEQFILNILSASASCKRCGKDLNRTSVLSNIICENCGFENKGSSVKDSMIQGVQKLSEYYNIPFKEAKVMFAEKMQKLRDDGKIYTY